MKSWKINTNYKGEKKVIFCTIVYESPQVYRIEIKGLGVDILLQNNFPIIKHSRNKQFKWSIMNSNIDVTTLDNATYLAKLMIGIEDYLRKSRDQ